MNNVYNILEVVTKIVTKVIKIVTKVTKKYYKNCYRIYLTNIDIIYSNRNSYYTKINRNSIFAKFAVKYRIVQRKLILANKKGKYQFMTISLKLKK